MYSLVMGKMFQSVPLCSSNISVALWLSVKKMINKTITFTLILALLLSPTVQTLRAQETEPVTEDETIDPALLKLIRTQAMERKQEMLNILGQEPYSPDVENSLQHAEQAMTQAQNPESSPHEAAQNYLRAIKQYRNTLRHYLEDNPDVSTRFEAQDATSPEVEIVTQEEIEAAKTQLLERFQMRFRLQLEAMMRNVDDLEDELSTQDAFKAREALRNALQKTLRIQERIEAGEYDEAVDELDEATESLEEGFEAVEDPDAAQMLRAMNRLEVRIQKMVQNAARKAAAGEDSSGEDSMLEELWGNRNKLVGDYRVNKGKGGEQGSQGGNGRGNN